ncbi:unnamed protein product [Calicophoron daubneyi]|uniref:Sodium/hydrogen exchanger n=1 Tax=Calicophoron daubneyi TaxID=300641 RepID=A0AAV2U0L8_CALDB
MFHHGTFSLGAASLLLLLGLSYASEEKKLDAHTFVADWKFDEYQEHVCLMFFLLCVIGLRMVYQRIPLINSWIPESLILLVAGIIFGAAIRFSSMFNWNLSPNLFFHYLLPPIILDSSYALYNSQIFDYIFTILLFAVCGTVMNFVIIAGIMYGAYVAGAYGSWNLDFDLKTFLLFSSLIVAVDPVAVLAIFQDIGVNLGLYYMVFGEALLNDAVTIVLYQVMITFSGLPAITPHHVLLAFLSVFTVSLGGLLVGSVVGVITCFITRAKSSLGAATVLILGYFSYIMGDCFGWSGIISMIACGLIQTAYAFHNISRVSVVLVTKVTKLVAQLSESVIFLFIGLEVSARNFEWYTGLYLWCLFGCLVARLLTVLVLSGMINHLMKIEPKISLTEQVILIYGGLRGAVCFCLADLIKPHFFLRDGEHKREILVMTTLFIIFFTVAVMGMTMKPLVQWLKVPMRKEQKLSLFHQLNNHVVEECMSAIEAISGERGRNAIRDWFFRIDDKYIRKWLQRDPETHNQKIVRMYEKIALKLHYAMIKPARSELYLSKLPESLKTLYTTTKAIGGSEINLFHATSSEVAINTLQRLSRLRQSFGYQGHTLPGVHGPGSELSMNYNPRTEQFGRAVLGEGGKIKISEKILKLARPDPESQAERESVSDNMSIISGESRLSFTDPIPFRSSRQASMIAGAKEHTDFADDFYGVLMSKSMMAKSGVGHHYMPRKQFSEDEDEVDKMEFLESTSYFGRKRKISAEERKSIELNMLGIADDKIHSDRELKDRPSEEYDEDRVDLSPPAIAFAPSTPEYPVEVSTAARTDSFSVSRDMLRRASQPPPTVRTSKTISHPQPPKKLKVKRTLTTIASELESQQNEDWYG